MDVACLDITDFSACGRASQKLGCDSQDYALIGIQLGNTSTHDTLTDLRLFVGLLGTGLFGPAGDGVVMDYIDILGNARFGLEHGYGERKHEG